MRKLFPILLAVAQHGAFAFIILLPAPLLSGENYLSIFILRFLACWGTFVYAARLLFFGEGAWFWNARALRLPAALFFVFVSYVFFQAFGPFPDAMQPGSAAPHATFESAFQWVIYALVFFLGVDFASSRRRMSALIWALAAEICFLIILGYYLNHALFKKPETLLGLFKIEGAPNLYSSFSNPNFYGGYLMTSAALFAAEAVYSLKRFLAAYRENRKGNLNGLFEPLFFLFVLALVPFSILDAEARAAFLGYVAVVIAVVLGSFPSRRRTVMLVLFFLLTAMGVYLEWTKGHGYFLDRFGILADAYLQRFAIQREAFEIFRRHPFFGIGLGAVGAFYPIFQKTYSAYFRYLHVFNHHLELLIETGILGYMLFIGAMGIFLIRTYRRRMIVASKWARHLMLGFAVLLPVHLALSFVDTYLSIPAIAVLLLWFAAFIGAHVFLPPADARSEKTRGNVLIAAALLFFVSIFSGFGAYRLYQAASVLEEEPPRPQAVRQALEFWPRNVLLRTKSGEMYLEEAESESAIREFEKAVQTEPTRVRSWIELGRARILAGDRRRGLEDIVHGADLMPANSNYYLFVILSYIEAAESTPWPAEREAFKQKAFTLLRYPRKLPRPLEDIDSNFLRSFMSLSDVSEAERLVRLLNEYARQAQL